MVPPAGGGGDDLFGRIHRYRFVTEDEFNVLLLIEACWMEQNLFVSRRSQQEFLGQRGAVIRGPLSADKITTEQPSSSRRRVAAAAPPPRMRWQICSCGMCIPLVREVLGSLVQMVPTPSPATALRTVT